MLRKVPTRQWGFLADEVKTGGHATIVLVPAIRVSTRGEGMFRTTQGIVLAAICAGATLVARASDPQVPSVNPRQTISLSQPDREPDPAAVEPVLSSITLSSDGRYVVTAGDDHQVRVWSRDAQQGLVLVTQYGHHSDWVRATAIRPDGVACMVRAWGPEQWYPHAKPEFELTLTESADPGSEQTWCKVANPLEECFRDDELTEIPIGEK